MVRCKPCACILSTVLALCSVGPDFAWAQASVQDLKGKSNLDAGQLARIDGWLEGLIADLESARTADGAFGRSQDTFVNDLREAQAGAAPAFRRTLAERCGTLFTQRIKSSNGQLSYALLAGLRGLGHPATLDAYRNIMDSPDAAVRLLAVRGVRHTADPGRGGEGLSADQIVATIGWLADAGNREADDLVLASVYRTIAAFPQSSDEQAKAILRILEARRQRLGQADDLPGMAAETAAFAAMNTMNASLSAEEQVRLVQSAAAFYAQYCSRLLEHEALESNPDLVRLTVACENLLNRIASVSGKTTAALAGPEANREDGVLEAARALLGTTSANGALNGGRWQVPVGGGVAGISFE